MTATLAGVFIGRGRAVHAAPITNDAAGPPLCGQRGRRYRTGSVEHVTCQRCLRHLPQEEPR